ncbi:MAG: CcdB family protein [Alphaproteobacteria bacterium]|nr:CcdB family protein [Alphaproteobacteria bacterium]
MKSADLLADFKTRVVIPLLPYAQVKQELLPKLKPIIKVKGENYSLMMTDIGVLRVSDLKNSINNVEDQRQTIVDALNFLFQGF